MREGDPSPWGTVDHVTKLGPEVHFVSTPSHGGLRLTAKAKQAVPVTVRHTFINGGEWAEEDLEASIALPFLHTTGLIDTDPFGKPFDELLDDARRIANGFEQYLPAAKHLETLKSRKKREPPAPTRPAGGGPATAGLPANA